MATFLPIRPTPILSPFQDRTRLPIPTHPLLHRTQYNNGYGGIHRKQFRRGEVGVVRFGFRPPPFLMDSDGAAEGVIKELFGRAESVLYTIADAAVSSSDTVSTTKQSNDWLSGVTYYMESVLKVLKDGLSTVHVPYAYGFAIILLTVLVKAATFPLTKKQVESAMAMRSLQPQIKAIQERYAGNQERIQLETARLYKLAGINPLAGCLPTLATIPVWIGLYRALSNVADEGLLTEGFFWIPTLAGPTSIAARQNGSGISWLFPFVDGHPPLGWSDTFAYLVLPVLLVISQYVSVQIMQSSQANNDPNLKTSQAITKFLPLMIGYFALSVPSGLSLYWFTNNILSTVQQVWLQKLGGAANPMIQFTDDIIKEEEPQIQRSALEISSTKEVARLGEKPTSTGPSPGERFKRIKEEEARRRRQREEEKRKAEEAAAESGSQVTNEAQKKESTLVGRDNTAEADLIDDRNGTVPSTNNGIAVNGNIYSHDLKKDQGTQSMLRSENTELSANIKVDGRDEQLSYKLEKVSKDLVLDMVTGIANFEIEYGKYPWPQRVMTTQETVEASTTKITTNDEHSNEDSFQARTEQSKKREDV